MTALQRLNLAVRVLLELGVVVALGYWGVHTGQNVAAKILLGAGAPTLGFGLWGGVDFQRAAHGELLRLTQELTISALAAIAWYAAGQHTLGLALASVSLGYHALVYASGERLLNPAGKPTSRSSQEASLTP